jgi:hypothetical protein
MFLENHNRMNKLLEFLPSYVGVLNCQFGLVIKFVGSPFRSINLERKELEWWNLVY